LANSAVDNTLLQKLCEVNKEWLNTTRKIISYSTSQFYYTKHLQRMDCGAFNSWWKLHFVSEIFVICRLRRLATEQRCWINLQQYHQAGVFPINDYLPYKNPIFIDRIGTHCAVGYLMQQSGAEDLAQRIDLNKSMPMYTRLK
jgi:hypothetical protein